MLKGNRNVLLGDLDQENLWSVRCDISELIYLFLNPPAWAIKTQIINPQLKIELADAHRHPDITILVDYPSGPHRQFQEQNEFVVEGISGTNMIIVRAPIQLAEDKSELLSFLSESGAGNTTDYLTANTGKVNVAIRPHDHLAHYHMELTRGKFDPETVVRHVLMAVTQPRSFFETLNKKAEERDRQLERSQDTQCDILNVQLVDDKGNNTAHFTKKPIRFAVPGSHEQSAASTHQGKGDATTNIPPGCSIDNLTVVYQFTQEIFDSACGKGVGTVTTIQINGKEAYLVCTDVLYSVAYHSTSLQPTPA